MPRHYSAKLHTPYEVFQHGRLAVFAEIIVANPTIGKSEQRIGSVVAILSVDIGLAQVGLLSAEDKTGSA